VAVFARTTRTTRARSVPNGTALVAVAARAAQADFSRVMMFEASQTSFFAPLFAISVFFSEGSLAMVNRLRMLIRDASRKVQALQRRSWSRAREKTRKGRQAPR
jgi:hypothetical protein